MDCPLCVYRRIARQSLDALEVATKLLGMIDDRAQASFGRLTARLTEEFRETYRAEHPLSLATPV